MEHNTAKLRSIKAAAIDHLGLDSKKDKEWLATLHLTMCARL
jgi:hypothetical protein